MGMNMIRNIAPPGVQKAYDARGGLVLVDKMCFDRFLGGLKNQIVKDLPIVHHELVEHVRHSKYNVVVGNWQQLPDPLFDPKFFGGVLTFWTIAIAARIVSLLFMATGLVVAAINVPTHLLSPTFDDGIDDSIIVG